MRYVQIFLLCLQHVTAHKSRSLVWFLIALMTPLTFVMFWSGAYSSSTTQIAGWDRSTITSYYVILTLAGVMLMSHVEEEVAKTDIRDGHLVSYLLKPFSYYWIKFLEEVPYRLFQGFCALVFIVGIYMFFGKDLSLALTLVSISPILLSFILAFFIAQTFKMIIGLLALWFVDVGGFFQLIEASVFTFGGYLIPLIFMPLWLKDFSHFTPFPYIIYYPVVLVVEPLSANEILEILVGQLIWVVVLAVLYKILWRAGIKRFSGVGN